MDGVTISEGTCFRVVVPPYGADGQPVREIDFQPVPNVDIPTEVGRLRRDIDNTLVTLCLMFPVDQIGSPEQLRFKAYYEKLAGIAIAGIGQDQTELGINALADLKSEILWAEEGRVKNDYLKRLGRWCTGGTLVLLLAYLISDASTGSASFKNFILLVAGSLIGTWLSFTLRKPKFTFDELAIVENDRIDPPLRCAFVMGLSLFIGLVLLTQMVQIEIGAFDTNFSDSGSAALLIGLMCGIAEQKLSGTVRETSDSFFNRYPKVAAVDAIDGDEKPDGSGRKKLA